jgi:uncharacterized protein YkwD
MPPRHRFRTLLVLIVAAGGLLIGPLVQPAVASASGSYERSIQKHTNEERTQRDLKALEKSACLDGYAEKQARAMAAQQQMFHQELGPILSDCNLSQVGENVAYGYPSGKAVVAAWMASPGHRANLLNSRHRLIGVGAYQDVDGHWYVSQVLGRKAS